MFGEARGALERRQMYQILQFVTTLVSKHGYFSQWDLLAVESVDEDCEHENRLFEYYPFDNSFWTNWQDEDGSSYHYDLDDYYFAKVVTMMTLFPCKEVSITGKHSDEPIIRHKKHVKMLTKTNRT